LGNTEEVYPDEYCSGLDRFLRIKRASLQGGAALLMYFGRWWVQISPREVFEPSCEWLIPSNAAVLLAREFKEKNCFERIGIACDTQSLGGRTTSAY
jgi:hypothetical protein